MLIKGAMMERYSNFIIKRRWWVIAFWVIAAILIVSLSPKLSSVESNNESSFLPKGYESVEAINVAKKISSTSQDGMDIAVFQTQSGQALNSTDKSAISSAVNAISAEHLKHVMSISTSSEQLSPNKKVQLASIVYSGNAQATSTIDAVKTIRAGLDKQISGSDLKVSTTGSESISYDTQAQSQRALKIVGIGTILLVLFLPALIFRSPFAGLLPIISVGIVDAIATSLIADAAKLFNFVVSQQLSVIFTVVLFGIGTDYILFLLFRYRERLREGKHDRSSVVFALSRAGLAILSAALVVITSFSALFFAKFGIFHSMAPGLVICVSVMMLAALSLIPALVGVVQEKVFWPSKAWQSKSLKPTWSKKICGAIAKSPGRVAATVVALLILSTFALGYKADFSSFSQPPKGTVSATGYNALVSAFPAGVLDPTEVYVNG
jgi:RND superfamily putative drug exporter